MKLSVLQENLQKAITLASRFTSIKAQLPILGNILLKGNKSKLIISSTNLESSVSTSIGAKTDTQGEIAVPSKVFSEMVINLPKETVTLEAQKEHLKVVSGGFSSTVMGINTSDFPDVPSEIKKEKAVVVPKEELAEALSKVLYAVSNDETRPVLTGVFFRFSSDGIGLISTDGFRLCMTKIKNPKAKGKGDFIVPKQILSEIARAEDEEIHLEFREKEKQVLFLVGDSVFSSRLLEGTFPDYEKIIPKSSALKVRTDKEELQRAVKLASIFARDNANIVKLLVEKDQISVKAESSSSGNEETKVEAKIEGKVEKFEIAFNYKFIEDFLTSVLSEEIDMEFSEVDKPGVFLDPSNSDYLHLIMPVKIQD